MALAKHLNQIWETPEEVRGKVVKLLKMILTNVVQHPDDPKFQSMNFAKIRKKFVGCSPAFYFLFDAGFAESADGTKLEFRFGNREMLLKAHTALLKKIESPDVEVVDDIPSPLIEGGEPVVISMPKPKPKPKAIPQTTAVSATALPPTDFSYTAPSAMEVCPPTTEAELTITEVAAIDAEMTEVISKPKTEEPGTEPGEAAVLASPPRRLSTEEQNALGALFGGGLSESAMEVMFGGLDEESKHKLMGTTPPTTEATTDASMDGTASTDGMPPMDAAAMKQMTEELLRRMSAGGTSPMRRMSGGGSPSSRQMASPGAHTMDDLDDADRELFEQLRAAKGSTVTLSMAELRGLTKEQKNALFAKKREQYRKEKAASKIRGTRDKERARRDGVKQAMEAKRVREEQQLKSLAERKKREKRAEIERKKRVRQRIRMEQDARKRERAAAAKRKADAKKSASGSGAS